MTWGVLFVMVSSALVGVGASIAWPWIALRRSAGDRRVLWASAGGAVLLHSLLRASAILLSTIELFRTHGDFVWYAQSVLEVASFLMLGVGAVLATIAIIRT